MRRFGLILALVLVACAPVTTIVSPGSPGADAALLEVRAGVATLSVGHRAMIDLGVYVGGTNPTATGFTVQDAKGLRAVEGRCAPLGRGLGCDLGSFEADSTLRFALGGSKLTAYATYYRPGEPIWYTLPAIFR